MCRPLFQGADRLHRDREYWQTAAAIPNAIRLMVKRVFITSDFGDNGLPKWISWLRAIVDADDLPLNVSRETLQSTRFLKQVKQVLINRAIALLAKISEEDPEKYSEIIKIYGPALKLGAVDSARERQKIVGLTRWNTNLRNFTSLDEVRSESSLACACLTLTPLLQIAGSKKKGQKNVSNSHIVVNGFTQMCSIDILPRRRWFHSRIPGEVGFHREASRSGT